ncbi:hypothetical protein KP509_21G085700 [Ceratopteris richardii]|uniref:BHLH domain-containing protein n=1 Tax=Ceratopteris richardii TaxID=49495 RepID=A0A8T2SC17_CERRI|nr:hypothetical protein KP509_21G085700 [Ceratopteris richardii]
MSHCVPEWDAVPGKEMDSVWEPVDLFLPSKGKWDSGHTRRSDISSVPELNFEELCWEDGQLLVVLQGSSGRGIGKSRSCSQFNAAEANLGGDIHMDVPVDTNGTELIEPASINVQTQEDDLFSWLQHPSEDLMGRHERKNDMHVPGTSLAGTERIHSPDLIMQKYSYQNPGLLNSTENIMASKTRATDTIPAFSPNNKVGHRTNQEVEDNSMNIALQNQEICGHYRPLTPTTEMSTQVAQMPSASANEIHARSVTSVNKSGMKFSNFSRPAVTYKAGLNSLGMTNGISGTERLKQLDRVAVDVHKLEGMDSTTRYLKLNAPSREEGVVLATPSLPHVVGASGLQDSNQDFSPEMQEHINAHSVNESQEDRDPDASITVTLNRTSAMGIADCWKSSLISSTAHGIDGSGEVVEFPEPSDLSSSGGSEDSDGTDGRRVTGRSKRKKSHEEDSELQSEALKNEAASSKKPAVMVGNTTKRSRAAENHNQSERRRRDRISEKMKALQSLVPNSYKTDKASMLEEAITYIKALKSQIQVGHNILPFCL